MNDVALNGEPSPAWLTAVLRQAGVLTDGVVTAVEATATGAFNSRTSFLRVEYSEPPSPAAPARLILKRNLPAAWAVAAGADEVRFYRLVAELGDHPAVLPPCYAAAYDAGGGESYLLLEDLSATHAPPVTRDEQIGLINGVPEAAHQEAVVDTLAALHAYWWDHPRLWAGGFDLGYWSRDAERFAQYRAKRAAAWQRLAATESGALPARVRVFYERLFARLPGFWESRLAPRFTARRHLTLIHGDAYFANFLCPKTPGAGATYLLDWQSPSCDLGAYDLTNLLATFWTRAQRRAEDRERRLLRRYHAGLVAGGVRDFAWEDLLADYRMGMIFWVLMPIQDGADGSPPSYWRPKLRCLLEAFEDWECDALLSAP